MVIVVEPITNVAKRADHVAIPQLSNHAFVLLIRIVVIPPGTANVLTKFNPCCVVFVTGYQIAAVQRVWVAVIL